MHSNCRSYPVAVFWTLIALAAFLVSLVAAVTVWGVCGRLRRTERVASYDLTAAKEFVLGRLPAGVAGRLKAELVELLLVWHLDYLRSQGVAGFGKADDLAEGAAESPHGPDGTDEALLAVLRSARKAEVEVDAVDAAVVIEEAAQYLAHIGAVGNRVG